MMSCLRCSFCLIVLAVVACLGSSASAGETANFFVLKQTDSGLALETKTIAAGETVVVQTSDEIIDVIFPPSPGRSAGLVRAGGGPLIIVRYVGDELRLQVRLSEDEVRDYPARTIEDLRSCNVRVSVTGGGQRAAFLIEGNERVMRDVGPVTNMFAGRVPEEMLEEAYVVQTDTYRRHTGAPIVGVAPLEVDRWPIVHVTLPGGVESDFIVDLGAGETVIDRGLLPSDAEIQEAAMVEYSAAGMRTLQYAPEGATGQVTSVVGHTQLESLALGELAVPSVTATVLEEMPDIFGRPIGGILGLDVLRRCDRVVLSLGETGPSLRFAKGGPTRADGAAIDLPLAYVDSHLVVEAMVNETPTFFILDTGAPTTFLDEATAAASGVEVENAEKTEARGLDAGSVEFTTGSVESLVLGERAFADVGCSVAALAPFQSMRGEGQYVGLLGNDFFANFRQIEVDFTNRRIRFVE